MEQLPTLQELDRTKMDQRRTIATEGKGQLKSFTQDHAATRMRNARKIYGSLPKKNGGR